MLSFFIELRWAKSYCLLIMKFVIRSQARGGNSALHLCAIHDRVECMKLLLRSGADPLLKNAMDKTALDLAQERGHNSCEELVCHFIYCQNRFIFKKPVSVF